MANFSVSGEAGCKRICRFHRNLLSGAIQLNAWVHGKRLLMSSSYGPLQWRHNECHDVLNHRCLDFYYSAVCSGADRRKHQSSASLAFMWGEHRWLVNSPHKVPVTRKMFPFDDVIMRDGRSSLELLALAICWVTMIMFSATWPYLPYEWITTIWTTSCMHVVKH